MLHLRIVVPNQRSEEALALLREAPSVSNLIFFEGAAQKPEGDVILCDIAREDASVVISDLRDLEIERTGSIAIEEIDSQISESAERAEQAAEGQPSDAVVWEEVESRTSENTELSTSFLAFMVLACMIGAVGVLLDQTILIIGAMVVGPEFGAVAGICVATVQRRPDVAKRSILALAVGFTAGITGAWLLAEFVKLTDLTPSDFVTGEQQFTRFISSPDEFSLIVAVLAGTAGMLSLTSSRSGALIGVLISVTTIPAAANIGVAFAYQDWSEWRGAMAQLAINLVGMISAGTITLSVQRWLYRRRRGVHLANRESNGSDRGSGRSSHIPPSA